MITQEEMIALLIEACPSFGPIFEKQQAYWEDFLPYMILADFARHLLDCHRQHKTEDFPKVAAVIERLHIEGDTYVSEAATIGLLEGVQTIWENQGVDSAAFAAHLLPVSAKYWKSLEDFWNGRIRAVGEGL